VRAFNESCASETETPRSPTAYARRQFVVTKVDAAVSISSGSTSALDTETTGRRIPRLPGDRWLQLAQRCDTARLKCRRLMAIKTCDLRRTATWWLHLRFWKPVRKP